MKDLSPICPSCGEKLLLECETTIVIHDTWCFSDNGSHIYQKLPISGKISRNSMPQSEKSTAVFLLCPACGRKYKCHICQVSPMRAVAKLRDEITL